MTVAELIHKLSALSQDAKMEIEEDDNSRWPVNSVTETFYDHKENKYVVIACLSEEP